MHLPDPILNERFRKAEKMSYVWVTIGSAIGGLLRYAITRGLPGINGFPPYGTVLINVIGCFVIGCFGTLTLQGSRYQVSEEFRIFVMIGICGGFTTFSSFSLQTFDLLRSGAWGKALTNVVLSVVFCLAAVVAGHMLAQHYVDRAAIAQTAAEEELTG
jgi:CrcB protein